MRFAFCRFLWAVLLGVMGSLPTHSLRAQAFELPAPQRITEREGLPQAFVSAIVQDQQGFIWVGTRDGLCRYDGHSFKVFQPNPDGRPSLSYAGIANLRLDQHGRIWIMSEEGDLDIFYPKTETFVNLSRHPGYEKAMRGRELSFFRYDQQERLWLVPRDAAEVIRYDFKNHRVERGPAKRFFFQKNSDRSITPSDTIADIAEAADGRIWLTTTTGLKYLDPMTDRFQNYPTAVGVATRDVATPEGFPLRLYARPNGDLLLLYPYRLVRLRTDTGQAASYYLPVDGSSLQNWNFVTDTEGRVYFNHQGRLFGFSDREGVRILARQSPQRIETHGSRLWLDRSGVLWEGTRGSGIRKYDLSPNPFQATPYRHSFLADLRRELGLETSATVPPSPLDPGNELSSYQFRYTEDGQQNLWFNAGSSDICQLDLRTRQLTKRPLPVSFHNLFIDDIPCPLATGPDGEVWAVYDSLTWHYDPTAERWVEFSHQIPHERTGDVSMLTVDRQALWLATRQKGLWRLDRQTGQLRPYRNAAGDARSLSNDALLALSEDPTDPNRLWVGTFGGGLCAFDKRTGYFRRFTVADGLPNNVIYSVIPDARGYLWMGTNKGLCRFDQRSYETTTYTQEHGLLANEFNRFHWLKLPGERDVGTPNRGPRIIMGGLEGITAFYPVEVGQDEYHPPVELTSLLVNNQPVSAALTDSLPPQAVRSLTLAHDQNFVTAEFAALQFNGSAARNAGPRRPDNNRYRHRLEGLEDDWKESGRPVATYTNLLPGDYVLLLNATNTTGQWSSEVRRLAISIRPPVWATWWAYLLYALAVAGLARAGLRFYLARIKLRQTVALRQQEADQLRAVNEMKSDFFANITHEFRTPLTLILAPTQQLQREGPDPENYQRHLSTITRNAHRLLGLVDQLLDFSKLEAGALPVVASRGDLQAFMARTVNAFRELAHERAIELSFTSENMAESYWFDADKLERILYNLLANALNYTEQGSVSVQLFGTEDGVNILVKDTGPGIAADQLPHLFDRYYRVPPRRAENNGQRDKPVTGTGLGLALVKELVDLQHGRVSVSSEPGSGTIFVVELPYRSAATLPDEAAPNPERVAADAPLVLVVEDNDELARYIAESLPADYRLLRASDGQAGWELALAELPDLILSDVMMPVMDGYELCQKLKTDLRTEHIPVLLLTAKASLDNRLEGLELGADDYLAKPFHVAELLLRVRNQLAHKQRLRQQLRAELSQPSGRSSEADLASENPFLRRLYALLDDHLHDDQLSIEQLIEWLDMSRTTFYRKLSALTDLTPAELIRLRRLKRATHHLRQGVSVAETAYRVGFKTPSHFTRVFREQYRVTPAKFARQKG